MQNISKEGAALYKVKVAQKLTLALAVLDNVELTDPKSAERTVEAIDAARNASRELHDEIDELVLQLKHEPDMPVKGEYYCYKDYRYRYVIQIRAVEDYRERNRNTPDENRYHPMITCVRVAVDGKNLIETLRFSLTDWMEKWEKEEISPVINALIGSRDISQGDVDRVKALLPFVQIPEGKYLNLDLLRRMAHNARKTAIKEYQASLLEGTPNA